MATLLLLLLGGGVEKVDFEAGPGHCALTTAREPHPIAYDHHQYAVHNEKERRRMG